MPGRGVLIRLAVGVNELAATHFSGNRIQLLQQHVIFFGVAASVGMVGMDYPVRHEDKVEKQSVLVFGQLDFHDLKTLLLGYRF
jgi:hypothetical protein